MRITRWFICALALGVTACGEPAAPPADAAIDASIDHDARPAAEPDAGPESDAVAPVDAAEPDAEPHDAALDSAVTAPADAGPPDAASIDAPDAVPPEPDAAPPEPDAALPRCPDPDMPLWAPPPLPIYPDDIVDLRLDLAPWGDGEHAAWWTLLEVPAESRTSLLGDDAACAVVPDMVGTYRVRADLLIEGCDVVAQEIDLAVVAPPGLYLEVHWGRLGDAMAQPADLDLLVRSPGLAEGWPIDPRVCDAHHPRPDWGAPGPSDDDPRMSLSPRDGGPEAVHIPAPTPGAIYGVAVHGVTLSSVQMEFGGHVQFFVRVYRDGAMVHAVDAAVRDADVLWWMADVVCDADGRCAADPNHRPRRFRGGR